jgi:ribonuclease BN (tRNA processing enzyme)
MTGMTLTVVGCSGSYPSADAAASCYLLEAEHDGRTWRILLDLGPGSLGSLQRFADPLAIDAVFLSHLHADHCLDLCGYYVLRKYHPDGTPSRLPVWGPAGVAGRLARAYDIPEAPGMAEVFRLDEYGCTGPAGAELIGAELIQVGPFAVEPIAVVHPVPAYGLRVQVAGAVLAYTGDTGPCPALDSLARGADLLLAEASFYEGVANLPDVHLTGKEAAEAAARAGVGRLVLTHIPPWHDWRRTLADARLAFTGPIDLATPGSRYLL